MIVYRLGVTYLACTAEFACFANLGYMPAWLCARYGVWKCRICLEDRFLTIAIVAQGPKHIRLETVLSYNSSLVLVDIKKRKRKATISAGN